MQKNEAEINSNVNNEDEQRAVLDGFQALIEKYPGLDPPSLGSLQKKNPIVLVFVDAQSGKVIGTSQPSGFTPNETERYQLGVFHALRNDEINVGAKNLLGNQLDSIRAAHLLLSEAGPGMVADQPGQIRNLVFDTNERLTTRFIYEILLPYLEAIVSMQQIIDMIIDNPISYPRIREIKQHSPITVGVDGIEDAATVLQDILVPWRRKHSKRIAKLEAALKQSDIMRLNAEAQAVSSKAKRDEGEAKKLQAEANLLYAQAEKLRLEVEQQRLKLQHDQTMLAINIVERFGKNLEESEKIEYVTKLLPALNIIIYSELEPLA